MAIVTPETENAEQGRNIITLLAKHKVIRLDLGGGRNPFPNHFNVDICDFDEVDIIADLRKLDEVFPARSVDAMMCRDVLQCFKATEVKGILRRWAKVLKPRSKFVLQVVDARQLFEAYVEDRVAAPWSSATSNSEPQKENTISYDKWKTYLYGPCRDQWTCYHNCFDEEYLRKLVESVGFLIKQVDYPPLRLRFTMLRKEHKPKRPKGKQ